METVIQERNAQIPPHPAVAVQKEKFLPEWIIVMLLLVFPPVAWYIMWRENHYHNWFTSLLLVSGILSLLTFFPMLYAIPQIATIYQSLNLSTSGTFIAIVWIYSGIVLSIFELVLAFVIREKVKAQGHASNQLLLFAVLILCVTYLLISVGSIGMGLSIIVPLYKVLQSSSQLGI